METKHFQTGSERGEREYNKFSNPVNLPDMKQLKTQNANMLIMKRGETTTHNSLLPYITLRPYYITKGAKLSESLKS